jgi:SAM-dependent methyltransferase
MANDRQFRVRTDFVAARDVHEYRATIPTWVDAQDAVLEIGCEWGTTTRLIAERAGAVVGTDVSADCIERARRENPGIRFEVLDGFDARAALELAGSLGRPFTKVYIDMSGISGYRSLLDCVALLQMYGTVLRPKAIVVKCAALKNFARHCIAWTEGTATE